MASDIMKLKNDLPTNTFGCVVGVDTIGNAHYYNRSLVVQPNINDIKDKYDNRFYSGIFVELVGNSTIIGG